MKVVLDTNIYVSTLHFGGAVKEIFKALGEEKITVCVSEEITREVLRILKSKLDWSNQQLEEARQLISSIGEYYPSPSQVTFLKSDPSDNIILACAVAAKADYIITGDKKHILPLKKIGRTKIVSAAEFLKDVHL